MIRSRGDSTSATIQPPVDRPVKQYHLVGRIQEVWSRFQKRITNRSVRVSLALLRELDPRALPIETIESSQTEKGKTVNDQCAGLQSIFDDGEMYDVLLSGIPYGFDFYTTLAKESKGPV